MAEQPSNSNPFLDRREPAVPEKPMGTTLENFSAPAIPDESEAEDTILTPESKRRQRVMKRIAVALVLIATIAGVMYWWFRDVGDVPDEPKPVTEVKKGTVPPIARETGTLALPDDSANYESENFKAGEIVIGGELQFLVDEDEVGALGVDNIRGEAFTEKNKQEVKLVVTWTTNKLARAAVKYSKGIGQTERSVDEIDYSYNHSIIISGLDPASTYLYTINATDRYGNRAESEPHAVFTGARTVSLFDLIAGAIGEVFGWAVTNK